MVIVVEHEAAVDGMGNEAARSLASELVVAVLAVRDSAGQQICSDQVDASRSSEIFAQRSVRSKS